MKGVHLESYILFDNPALTTINMIYSTNSLATPENPLYILIYDDYGYGLTTVTSSQTNNLAGYTRAGSSGTDRFLLMYGNLDSLTLLNNHNSSDQNYISGDLKSFIDSVQNLEELTLYQDKFTVNMDNFKWPNTMKTIDISYSSNLVGDIGTMEGLENLEYLKLQRVDSFGGDIKSLDNLTYLDVDSYTTYYNMNSDLTEWNFVPNLTTLRLRYTYGIYGNMSGFTFNDDFYQLDIYNITNSNLEGDLTNWDFGNCASLNRLSMSFSYSYKSNITGDLSQWTFNDNAVISSIYFRYADFTNIGLNLSNVTSLGSLSINTCNEATNEIGDILLPDNTQSMIIQYANKLSGSINDFIIPSSMYSLLLNECNAITGDVIAVINNMNTGVTTSINIYGNNLLSGDISGLTMWEGLAGCNIRDNNIGGTLSPTTSPIPSTLTWLAPSQNPIVLDLSSTYDFKNITQAYLNHLSGITGDFSNIYAPKLTYLSLNNNTFNIDLGDLALPWNIIQTLRVDYIDSPTSDITNWFSGSTADIRTFYANESNFTGDISNWNMGNWSGNPGYSTFFQAQGSGLSGNIGNWNSPIPRFFYIQDTAITGNITSLDFETNETQIIHIENSNMYSDLSGVTLDYRISYFYAYGCSGITGTDAFVDYVWLNRKNWLTTFRIDITTIGDTITGTYQLGDTGTYPTGSTSPEYAWDLTEAELNNLVLGNDYDGGGSNTPWTQNEKRYYMLNAKVSSVSTTAKYTVYVFSVS